MEDWADFNIPRWSADTSPIKVEPLDSNLTRSWTNDLASATPTSLLLQDQATTTSDERKTFLTSVTHTHATSLTGVFLYILQYFN